MIKPITASLVLLCLCAPADAQRGGSSNNKAPNVTSSIEFTEGTTLQVTHQSITWAEGRTMKNLMDKDGGATLRERWNARAVSRPLGSVVAGVSFTIGDKMVEAGEYDLYFTLDDDLKWHLNLANKTTDGPAITWALPLEESDQHHARLVVSLTAGDKDGTGRMWIAFGTQYCWVQFMPADDQ